jgi:hypothetical protein
MRGLVGRMACMGLISRRGLGSGLEWRRAFGVGPGVEGSTAGSLVQLGLPLHLEEAVRALGTHTPQRPVAWVRC